MRVQEPATQRQPKLMHHVKGELRVLEKLVLVNRRDSQVRDNIGGSWGKGHKLVVEYMCCMEEVLGSLRVGGTRKNIAETLNCCYHVHGS